MITVTKKQLPQPRTKKGVIPASTEALLGRISAAAQEQIQQKLPRSFTTATIIAAALQSLASEGKPLVIEGDGLTFDRIEISADEISELLAADLAESESDLDNDGAGQNGGQDASGNGDGSGQTGGDAIDGKPNDDQSQANPSDPAATTAANPVGEASPAGSAEAQTSPTDPEQGEM